MAKKLLFAVALAVIVAAGALWVLVSSREKPMVAMHSLPSQTVVPVLPDELHEGKVTIGPIDVPRTAIADETTLGGPNCPDSVCGDALPKDPCLYCADDEPPKPAKSQPALPDILSVPSGTGGTPTTKQPASTSADGVAKPRRPTGDDFDSLRPQTGVEQPSLKGVGGDGPTEMQQPAKTSADSDAGEPKRPDVGDEPRIIGGNPSSVGVWPHIPYEPHDLDATPRCKKLGIVASDCIDFDAILEGLEEAWAGYTCPKRMRKDRETSVTLVLDPSKKPNVISEQTAKTGMAKVIGGEPQQIVPKVAKWTSQMSASLEGASFEIEPSGLQKLTVTKANPVTWQWHVTPTEEGAKKLTLKLFVEIGKDEENTHPVPINTLTEDINVYVTTWDQTVALVSEANVFAESIAGIGAALMGWMAWLYRKAWLPLLTRKPNEPRKSSKARKPSKTSTAKS